MTPSQAVVNRVAPLLAADTIAINPAGGVKVILAINPFTPGLNLAIGSVTPATFSGSAALVPAGIEADVDPLTGDPLVMYTAPEGGYRWACDDTTTLTETVYGFCVVNTAGTVVIGSERLDEPMVINAVGKMVEILAPKFRVPAVAVS